MTELQQYIKKELPQLAKEFLPDSHGWTNRFPIKSSSSNRMYNIAQRISDGTWGCSCMGWIRYKTCTHLKNIMPSIRKAEEAAGIKKSIVAPTAQSEIKANIAALLGSPEKKKVKKEKTKKVTVDVVNSVAISSPTSKSGLLGALGSSALVKADSNAVVKVKKPFKMPNYKTYDTSEGFGSTKQWQAAFEERMNYRTFTLPERKEKEKGLCDILYAAETYDELHKHYKELIRKYHPDINGDTEDNKTNSQLLNDAFFELRKKFK